MIVYVLSEQHEYPTEIDAHITGVFDHYNKAFEFAEQRTGRHFNWTKHDSHGVSWESDALIDERKKYRQTRWFVEEFEVQ